jgi:hypothetical protein
VSAAERQNDVCAKRPKDCEAARIEQPPPDSGLSMTSERRAAAFEAVERATELPVLVLALVLIPLLIAPIDL